MCSEKTTEPLSDAQLEERISSSLQVQYVPALRHVTLAGAVLALAVLAAGCSKSAPALKEVHPVTGQVLFDGRPAAGAYVVFHPKDETTPFPKPYAKVDAQGNFALTTYNSQDGAPAGQYAVTVELRPVITKDGEVALGDNKLPPKYGSPKTTTVVAQVAEGQNSLPIKITR